LAALIGRPHIVLRDTNRADAKPYAALYREFRARFRIPADLVAEIYDRDPYLRHFYTDEEIAAFKAKWTAPQPREARPLQ
jgi:deoxycytidine triphosphate deaminase